MFRTSKRQLPRLVATAAVVCLSAVSAATPASASSTFRLYGTLAGSYQVVPSSNADSGQHYQLYRGKGRTSLGNTTSSGKTSSLGFVRAAYCNLSYLLVTSSGKVSVRIRSKQTYPGGFSCKNYAFTWRTVRTEGAYAGKTSSGTGTLAMSKTGSDGVHGTFTITFDR